MKGLCLALLLWGLYLAVVASLYNYDIRKGVIVLSCTLAFLAVWSAALRFGRNDTSQAVDGPNRCCQWALVTAGIGLAMTVATVFQWVSPQQGSYRASVLVSQGAVAVAAILAIIGLSNPGRPQGKWMGLLAIVLSIATIALGFFMTPVLGT